MQIENLANANVDEIYLKGNFFVLNFGAELKKSTNIIFAPGVVNAELIVSDNTALQIRSAVSPTSSRKDDFSSSNKTHLNRAAREHPEALLKIHYAGSSNPLKLSYISPEKSESISL